MTRKTIQGLTAFLLTSTVVVACSSDRNNGASEEHIGTAESALLTPAQLGFEANDGDLAPNQPGILFDWNSFAPTTWTGTAPTRVSAKTLANGWKFTGIEDYQNTTADTGFAGGTKQNDRCPAVIAAKAANKDDLKRIYVASDIPNTGDLAGHVLLTLAWARIPQNTTSASAHVAFEMNQGDTPCGGNSNGLIQRTAGDLLIVYDFEGGSSVPTLKLNRWVTSGACEVGTTLPCWGTPIDLTGSGFAIAAVSQATAGVVDTIGPPGQNPDTLLVAEFGEAGVDLTAAGIFNSTTCQRFGHVSGVSRTSGSSATAQMKDLVGPGALDLSNCGSITIDKVVPGGDPTNTAFDFTTTNLTPSSFTLTDSAAPRTFGTLNAGTYSVTEQAETGFALTNLNCTVSGAAGSTFSVASSTATINLVGTDNVTCTFTNSPQKGALKVHKTSVKGPSPLGGVTFQVKKAGALVATVVTDSNGDACVDNLAFGSDYTVQETAAPTGYQIDDPNARSFTINAAATCSTGTPVTQNFSDTPLSRISVSFESLAAGNPTSATIVCTPPGGAAVSLPEGTPHVLDNLVPGTYSCTVVVDP